MKTYIIDINADVGEGMGNESRLIPLLSSCNIACGGHTGDEFSMISAIKLAKTNHVRIGAHPSFPDPDNFGRKLISISDKELFTSLKNQIHTLLECCDQQKVVMHHVKPHGALYNLAAKDQATAEIVVAVVKQFHASLKLYVPYGSIVAEVAKADNIPVVYEAFTDRNYNTDLSLVSREHPNALIEDADKMFSHVYEMIVDQSVTCIGGAKRPIKASTFCIHGDHHKALDLALELRQRLHSIGIEIQ